METSWETLGARVRQARHVRQLDQSALAARIGVERSSLVKVESGTRRVTALELAALSQALSVPMTYFVTQPPAAMVSQRAVLDGPATDRERVRFEADLALEQHLADVQQIKGLGVLPGPEVSCSRAAATRDDARALAREVRLTLGMGGDPLPGMADVAARCGMWLLVVDGGLEGASVTPEEGFGVGVLGAEADSGRRRFTAAHELGHHLMGDEYSSDIGVAASRDERERVVDAFAQELLLPTESVQAALVDAGGDQVRDVLIDLAARYRVSWSAVLGVAESCRTVDQAALRAIRRQRPLRSDFIRLTGSSVAPDLEVGQTAAAWQQAVLAAHRESWITGTRAVELLHGVVSSQDLPELTAPVTP